MKTKNLELIISEFKEDIQHHYNALLDMTCLSMKCLQQNDGIDQGFAENQSFFIEACNELLIDLTNERDIEKAIDDFCGTSDGNSEDALSMLADRTDQLLITVQNAKHYLDNRRDLSDEQRKKRLFKIEETARQIHELLRALRAHYSSKKRHALAA